LVVVRGISRPEASYSARNDSPALSISTTVGAKISCGAYKKTYGEKGFSLPNRARTNIGDTLINDQNIETWFHVARVSLFVRGPEFLKVDGG
jgi:hypothetical protein